MELVNECYGSPDNRTLSAQRDTHSESTKFGTTFIKVVGFYKDAKSLHRLEPSCTDDDDYRNEDLRGSGQWGEARRTDLGWGCVTVRWSRETH